MELIKKNIHMDREKCRAVTQITLEDDINVSDNKPDVAQLIFDKGNVKIEEIKPTEDHVSVKGQLHFQVLYLSSEGQSRAVSIEGKIAFEEQVYMENVQSADPIQVRVLMEDLTVGLINSRKLSVQAVLTMNLAVEELYDEEAAVEIYHEEPIEYCKKSLQYTGIAIQKKDIFRIREEMELPQNLPNVFELIWDSIQLGELEFKALNDKITVQGEVKAFFLYEGEGEEQPIRWYETSIPFSGVVDCYGCKDSMIPNIDFAVMQQEVEVRPDFDGEERMLALDMVLDLEMKLYEEEKTEILSDVYGVDKEINAVTRPGEYKQLLIRNAGKCKATEHMKIKSSDARVLQLCHDEAEAQIDNVNVVENGIEVNGTVTAKILYVTSDDKIPFHSIKGMIPFSTVLEAPGVRNGCQIKVEACVEQLAVSLMDSEELEVKAIVGLKAIVFCNFKMDMISDIRVEAINMDKINELPGIAAYIAKDGDTLWQIGKRYYVPVSQIREVNGLTNDHLKTGDKLLVVRGMN